jgi:hypothetical protein
MNKATINRKEPRNRVGSRELVGRFGRLLSGNILGVIDAYGAVHSVFTGDEIEYHSEHFPQQTHRLWRWNDNRSIHWFTSEGKLNGEEYEAVQRHLTKRYGIKWWENGHHDIDHLQTRAEAESSPNVQCLATSREMIL